MKAYSIDLSQVAPVVPRHKAMKLFIEQPKKAPLKQETMKVYRDNDCRLSCYYQKPKNLKIGGQKINNVIEYSVSSYKDALTDNGKLYCISTPNSEISLYTHDNKFEMMNESYLSRQKINIGEHSLYGDVSKTTMADGSKVYEVITPNFKIKKIKISPEGIISGPKKSSFELMKKNILQIINNNKFISKLLKKF